MDTQHDAVWTVAELGRKLRTPLQRQLRDGRAHRERTRVGNGVVLTGDFSASIAPS